MGVLLGVALFMFIFIISAEMYNRFHDCATRAEMENDSKRWWEKYQKFQKENKERKEKWDSLN